MRIIPFHRESDSDYSCISYWLLGDVNASTDRNTLIDTGNKGSENSAFFMRSMAAMSKGIGKMAVEQIIITHDHYDHAGGLGVMDQQFAPQVFSYLPSGNKHVPFHDGMHVRIGDQDAMLLHTPGHSDDSICIYVPTLRILFSGDTVVRISDSDGSYSHAYLASLQRLAALDIAAIYPGHGAPIAMEAGRFIRDCIDLIIKSPRIG